MPKLHPLMRIKGSGYNTTFHLAQWHCCMICGLANQSGLRAVIKFNLLCALWKEKGGSRPRSYHVRFGTSWDKARKLLVLLCVSSLTISVSSTMQWCGRRLSTKLGLWLFVEIFNFRLHSQFLTCVICNDRTKVCTLLRLLTVAVCLLTGLHSIWIRATTWLLLTQHNWWDLKCVFISVAVHSKVQMLPNWSLFASWI